MTDELRAKFEVWANRYGLRIRHHDIRDYWYSETMAAWEIWQAAHASRDAEVEKMSREMEIARAQLKSTTDVLVEIYSLLYPPAQMNIDGKAVVFRSQEANTWMQCLSDRIRAIPSKIDAAMAKESGE